MRLIVNRSLSVLRARLRRLPAAEEGFTMIVTIGVFLVTSLLVAAAFVAAQSDIHLTQHDLDQKRALDAARAGVNEIIYQLDQQPNYWTGCPSQSKIAAPGTSVGEEYSFKPLPANGATACSTTNPIPTMIDTPTGTFRMQVTGYAGNPEVSRTLVVGFGRPSPLDFLWYTDYETLDPATYPDPTFAANNCTKWHRDGRHDIQHTFNNITTTYCGDIDWIHGDQVNGPMYTEDQYAICGDPVFGRDSNDYIESAASNPFYAGCSSPGNQVNVKGQQVPNAGLRSPPPDNGQLLTDAGKYGIVYTGTTKVVLTGTTYSVYQNGTQVGSGIPLSGATGKPIIYVRSNSGCSTAYTPYNPLYDMSSPCGNVYVSGTFSKSVTIAADNDIVVEGSVTTAHDSSGNPTGAALLGLVANNFVRVEHAVAGRGTSNGACGPNTNTSPSTQNPTIDAAILALKHSFIVDNYDCGNPLGTLTVNGAIAQNFRGTVGTHSGSTVTSGYLKNYSYDDRLKAQEPPYMFDIFDASWHIQRETLCQLGASDTTACG